MVVSVKFNSASQLNESIHSYITWYNTKRLHSSLGYLTPLEMELKLNGVTKIVINLLGSPSFEFYAITKVVTNNLS